MFSINKTKTQILTHRGLDPSLPNFPIESSSEAFTNQLQRNYGLEFDLQVTKDGELIVMHDSNLKRISKERDLRSVKEVMLTELLDTSFEGFHLITAKKLIQKIRECKGKVFSAIHIKKSLQEPAVLDRVLNLFDENLSDNCILFDLSLDAASYIKNKNKKIMLAASVAHPYDIYRFNASVGNTLISIDDLLAHKNLFDWAWLDEWDLTDENGGNKTFINEDTIQRIRGKHIKIAVVSPELHASSPALLGGEAHQSASDFENLKKRIRDIIKLQPDIICTDYPDLVKVIINEIE